ncbi:MAG: XRE family transcriptional regulator [Pedobacter sp.]|nr:MAG: XRE family transcriptional regulator [Pedobacter sp.]
MQREPNLSIDTIVSNIRRAREFRNLTQDYLAAQLGISQNAYSKLELGYSKITLARFFKIAQILDFDFLDLITWDPKKHSS